MSVNPWWQSAVVYQIYPRSFADSNGDGIGDLRGIIGKLDYLARLGVDVIWLSPIYRSPHDDNGYDISDYQAIDPVFGTLDDFDALVAGLHARGMKLVMDLVVNHTSDEHPWFLESASDVSSPKRDWYIWRPPLVGAEPGSSGAEPNNWESFFGGSAWKFDASSGEYYLHLFSRKQPDLNWDNPRVRRAVHRMMRWWLDRGVDGFRMDVINFISKPFELPDGEVRPGALYGDGTPYYSYGPRIHEYLQEMRREVFAGRAAAHLTIGEMPGSTIEQARLYTDPDRGELDMIFQFEHVELDRPNGKFDQGPLDPAALISSLVKWQTELSEGGWNSLYLGNHDQPRAVSRFGDDTEFRYESATALATALHLMRGTPFVFQGDELGMANFPFASFDDFRDIESLNYVHEARSAGLDARDILERLRRASRDNARTPVQWDDSVNAGFTAGEPWIPVNPDCAAVNAAAQEADEGSVLNYYRKLIRLRHTRPAIAHGSFSVRGETNGPVLAFTRVYPSDRIDVFVNLNAHPVYIDSPSLGPGADLVISNYATIDDATSLRPWEARVMGSRDSHKL